ncbi:GAF domain-containing protein [Oscillochloris sp. ZM17-4]|uniref:GAF domain-containing protein n=1 Tax=Oscillochloris sp. ZM17-4 TaxID=2866714 RepID=UPI001C732B5C|nr:GAF domain-containing protein [Oscillochloris sp. ZM17-4]MBX0328516.1 GAF domain-containing protein [Oscillochloris sp. ZM17-4]
MDSTIASTPAYGWELLAQLAAWGQQGAVSADPRVCAGELADLLARYLPVPAGLVEIVEHGVVIGSATWGEGGADVPNQLSLHTDEGEIGRLYLHGASALDANFSGALVAQLSLLLASRQRGAEAATINQLRALISTSLESVGVLDVRTLLGTVLTEAVPLLGLGSAAIYSAEEIDQPLSLAAASAGADSYPPIIARDGMDLAARAAGEGTPQIGAIQVAATRRRGAAGAAQTVEHMAIALPLLAHDQPSGVMLAILPDGAHELTDIQMRMSVAFADQATLLLRNARLFSQQQQRARELFVLYENSKAISTGAQIESTLDRATENIALALDAEYCAVRLIEPQRPESLQTIASYGENGRAHGADGDQIIFRESAFLAQLGKGDPLLLEDVSAADSNPLAAALAAEGCRSALLLPLRSKDQMIGLLTIGYERARRPISQSERNLAQVLAAQIATAIANRRLYVVEQQRAAELEQLQRISQQLSAGHSLDETLDAILDGVKSLANFSGARIGLWDTQNRSLLMATSCGLDSPASTTSDSLSAWLVRHQRPRLIANLDSSAAHAGTSRQVVQIALEDGGTARSYLGLPMRTGDTLVGILELFASAPDSFSPENERLMSIIAGQSAQAIVNATRYEQADISLRARLEQLRALQRVSSQLAITLNQKEILAYALEQALRATGATHGLIALRAVDEDGGDGQVALRSLGGQQAPEIYRRTLSTISLDNAAPCLVVEAVGYAEPTQDALIGSILDSAAATAYTAMQRREPELSDLIGAGERSAVYLPDAASALAAPIFYQAGVAGVLLLLSPKPRSFDHDAVDFLRALTHQAAVGIGNAQRYAELEHLSRMFQRRASMLNDVLEIGQALRADRSLENLLEQVGYSVIDSANFRTILFCLADPDNIHMLRPVAAAGIPLNELDHIGERPLPESLATRYLDPRFRIGRSYFVPAEEATALEVGFSTSVFSYTSFDDERLPEEWQRNDRLCVPLYSAEGNMLGLMFASDPQDRQRPTARTVEPLEIFADQSAIAIENYHLLRDARARAEQMAALFQVGSAATSTTDLDTLLNRVYQEIVAYLGTPSFFFVARYEPERQRLRFEQFLRQGESLPSYHKVSIAKTGLSGLIIDTGKPLLINDMQADAAMREQSVMLTENAEEVRSWLGMPLISQGRVIGVLSVQDFAPNAFSERDQQFLSALASQLAIALENARLFAERERRIAELDVINQIGRITSSTLDLPLMLRRVYDQLFVSLEMDSFYIFVYDDQVGEILLSYEVDDDGDLINSVVRTPTEGSLTDHIIRTRQPLQFQNLAKEHEAHGFRPVRFGSQRRSAAWLGVPLMVGDERVVGVMGVMSYAPNIYGEREQSFLTTVANQLALGVQNARLLAQARAQVEQLDLLNRVSATAATETDVQQIYQRIVDAMAEATGVDQARLVLYDRKAGQATAVAEHVPTSVIETISIPLPNNPSVEWLDTHKMPFVSDNAQHDPMLALSHKTFRAMDIRSIALIPLVMNSEVIGAVGLDFIGRTGSFRPQALDLCQTIANQITAAIARTQAFAAAKTSANALSMKVGELSTLLDAARILSSLLQPDEVLVKLMELVSRQLSVTTVALWTIDGTMLIPAALDGIPIERGRTMRVPVGQGHTGRVAETGMPLIIDDVRTQGGSLYPRYERDNNLVSFMGVPVIYRERIIGVLSVMSNYPRSFSDDEMLLLVGLADQAATALENARLFQERERRISELSSINAISAAVNATLEQQDLLERLHHGISEILDVSTSIIAIYDEATDVLSYPVIYDRGIREYLDPAPLRNGTNAWAIRNRKPLLLYSLSEAQAMGLVVDEARVGSADRVEESYLVTPIIFGSKVLGVINIQSYEQRAFDENDLRFLTTVANQAAVAINNAILFSETRQNAQEMTTLFEVTQNLSGTLDPDETQLLVAESALRLIGVEMCAVIQFNQHGQIGRQVLMDRGELIENLDLGFRLNGITGQLLERDQPLAISDLSALDSSILSRQVIDYGIRSALGVVIGSHDDRMGVLWVGARLNHEWSDRQISLISILANQASQALKSAQLYQMEQQRRRLADTLRDVAQSFTSTLALSEIQTLIFDQLARVVHYDSAVVLLRDEGYGHLQITEARGIGDARLLGAVFEVEEIPLFQGMALERRPVMIVDTQSDARLITMQQLGWDVRAWIGAPLLVDNELVGLLAIGSNTPYAYDDEAVEMTFALASQASQAIQNARLFDQISNLAADLERRVSERTAELEQATRQLSEEKDRLEAVHEITLELTTQLDLDSVIQRALELISENLGVARGSIMLRDTESGALTCRAVLFDRGDVHGTNIPLSFSGSEGLSGWVMRSQEAVNIADVLFDDRWVQEPGRADDVRSAAAVPLKTSDAALGVLVLSSPEVSYFTDSQMNLLGTIASVVASAVSNAQLYSFITELATRNSVLLEEQREESSKSAAVFRSVTEGVIVLDTQGQVTLFNPAAEQVLEIPAEALIGQPIEWLSTYGEGETQHKRAQTIYTGLMNGLKQVSQSRGIYRTSLDLTDPSQVIALNIAPVLGPGGQDYGDVMVLRDITREIEADEAKRQFISDVSHELRTPLTAIKGYVDVLLLSGTQSLSEDQVSYLGIIKNNTNRLKALIEDILEFSRPDASKKLNFSPISITDVINEAVQAMRLEYERKSMTVAVDMPSSLPMVMADQKRITQVVFNLFSNAVKYTFEGGRIQVRAFLNRANMLQVDVEDTGVGMSPDQRKKLFRPFYRADNPLRDVAGGTGLGLSIAKALIEQHGGEMWVTSEIGRGSTFSFIIPLQQIDVSVEEDDE